MTPEDAGKAWDLVVAGIHGAERQLELLRPQFIEMVVQGTDSRALERQAVDLISAEEWAWPLFEGWLVKFNDAGESPYMWDDLVPDEDEIDDFSPTELAVYRKQAIIPLVIHTAMMTAYSQHRLRNLVPPFHLTLSFAGDSVEDKVASQFAASIAAGDHQILPPFFPGDRTGVTYSR